MSKITILAILIWLILAALLGFGGYRTYAYFRPAAATRPPVATTPDQPSVCWQIFQDVGGSNRRVEQWEPRSDGQCYLSDSPTFKAQQEKDAPKKKGPKI